MVVVVAMVRVATAVVVELVKAVAAVQQASAVKGAWEVKEVMVAMVERPEQS